MNRRILIQVTTPAVLLGLLFVVTCLISAWYVNRLQLNLANIQTSNIPSLQAAREVETAARQLRFHCFVELIDPDDVLRRKIEKDRERFEESFMRAKAFAYTTPEQVHVAAVREGYERFNRDFDRMHGEMEDAGPRRDFRALADANRINNFVEPCREYWRVNEEQMQQTARESDAISKRLQWTMLLVGLAGPLGGVLGGFGIARGLSRSLFKISLRVKDVAQKLEQDAEFIDLAADGDLRRLDQQLHRIVITVAETVKRLHDQQRQMLRAQQLAAIGQLAASVAHEVRNPLTSIKMLVEAGLGIGKPKPFTAENLKVVHGEVLRLERTVQEFLDFARPPALVRKSCDVRDIVTRAIELVRARARRQKVRFDVDVSGSPVVATVDPDKICNVCVNLLINALDAMPNGGRLQVCLNCPTSTEVQLEVLDTGDGIRPEIFDQLFTPFSSTKATGSGLGLSISKRIVEEHGGMIAAANRAEGGARFAVTLPVSEDEENHAVIACR